MVKKQQQPKPRRKVEIKVDGHHVYPTLDMRQAAILLECIKIGMGEGLFVGGAYVDAAEWQKLIRTLFR